MRKAREFSEPREIQPMSAAVCNNARSQNGRRVRLLFSLSAVSLAFVLTSSVSAQEKQPPTTPLDLNSATAKELTALPGVGPVTAKAIVDFRQKAGSFRRVEDRLVIRGISEGKLKQIRPYVTVKPVAKPATPPKPGPKPVTPAKPQQ
jgi:competence protein ComEA